MAQFGSVKPLYSFFVPSNFRPMALVAFFFVVATFVFAQGDPNVTQGIKPYGSYSGTDAD